MATNQFATFMRRNTHRLVVVLVYAILEWLLIILLLLNSFFSYLIRKFAIYFGLKLPCMWCSRIDHFLEPEKNSYSYRDLVCDTHAAEISNLGYCSNHKKLVEWKNICKECSASRPRIGFVSVSLVNENENENGEKIFKCCCCNESLSGEFYPLLFLNPSWGTLSYIDESDLILEPVEDGGNVGKPKGQSGAVCSPNSGTNNRKCHYDEEIAYEQQIISIADSFSFKEATEEEDEVEKAGGKDDSAQFVNTHSENCSSDDDDRIRIVPVELIDSSTIADRGSCRSPKEKDLTELLCTSGNSDSASHGESLFCFSQSVVEEKEEKECNGEVEINGGEVRKSSVVDGEERGRDYVVEAREQVVADQLLESPSIDVEDSTEETDDPPASEKEVDVLKLLGDQTTFQNFSSTLVSNSAGHLSQPQHPVSSSPQKDLGSKQAEKTMEQEKLYLDEKTHEADDEKLPDTPTSTESLHYLHKKLLLFEKTESGAAEESLDGSVVSEFECGDASSTIERLKGALKAERKALSALYAELEEERSASAIAANQTMAMITRLQEEKASMQMEALQYQRMMEEQSEYDQEALQLLNELIIKREKEKRELEEEVDMYRKKVADYEEKENTRTMRRIKGGSIRSQNSSASYSHCEDTDEISIDLNRDTREEDSSFYERNNNITPADEVLNLEEMAADCVKNIGALDESLAEFEEERLSILDQLKALEERLMTLGGDDEEFLDGVKSVEDSSNCGFKEFDEKRGFSCPEEDGFSKENNHYTKRNSLSSMAKRLLPLLNATENETEEGFLVDYESIEIEMQNSSSSKFEIIDNNKIAIEDEVDHVYERLQALEADREFLKHCVSSIKKGDKGMDLLQEILQHLRDLRAVELRVKNMSESD